jgi:two-component system chemotaxis response regulator CheB
MSCVGPAAAIAPPIRVMLVDDSAVVRGLIARILATDAAIEVVASVGNGEMALARLAENGTIDVIVLDIEMPVMDGLTALPKLLAVAPGVRVIVVSSLTQRGAEISMRCLENGAVDTLPKPAASAIASGEEFRRDLLAKIRALGATSANRAKLGMTRPSLPPVGTSGSSPEAGASRPMPSLRSPGGQPPAVIAIGCSTGGPPALFEVLGGLRAGKVGQPVLVTQHMPPTFTAVLADRIARKTGYACGEGRDSEPILAGRVYLAPGGAHMEVHGRSTRPVLRLTADPPEHFCRPAVDPLLRSAAAVFGPRTLAIILTGMGADGRNGCEAVVSAGGTVIAQDEESSVVWGMPGAVAAAGLCSAVLPLPEVAPYVVRFAGRSGR